MGLKFSQSDRKWLINPPLTASEKTPSALILKTFSWLSTQRGMDGLVKASAGILSCLIAIDAPRPVQRLSWTAAASLQPLFWWLMVNNFLLLPLVCCLSSGMFYRQQLLSFGSRWLAPRIIVWQQMLSIIYRITRTCLLHLILGPWGPLRVIPSTRPPVHPSPIHPSPANFLF